MGDWTDKARVVWIQGAGCTGCSISVLNLFEDLRQQVILGSDDSTTPSAIISDLLKNILASVVGSEALDQADVDSGHLHGHRTLSQTGNNQDVNPNAFNIADLLIDFIKLKYHNNVMTMGGDLAYWHLDQAMHGDILEQPFVLVVEGAVQGVNDVSGGTPWCSIAKDGNPNAANEIGFGDAVYELSKHECCIRVIALGTCASFGGYPAYPPPSSIDYPRESYELSLPESFLQNQTAASGVYPFLRQRYAQSPTQSNIPNKVINVPGCPVHPWALALTAVLVLLEIGGTQIDLDDLRRPRTLYDKTVHDYCRWNAYNFQEEQPIASKYGEQGCLFGLGCKGMETGSSLCTAHGWNDQQPDNRLSALSAAEPTTPAEGACHTETIYTGTTMRYGGNCITAGHPCRGCTECGYPFPPRSTYG